MPKLTLGYMRVSETDECETKAALRKETPQLKKSQKARTRILPRDPLMESTVSSWPKSGRRSRIA